MTAVSPLNGSVFLAVSGENFASPGVVAVGFQLCVQNGEIWNDSFVELLNFKGRIC